MDRFLRQDRVPFTVIMMSGMQAEVLHVMACDDDFDVNVQGSRISFIVDECNRNGRDIVIVHRGYVTIEDIAGIIDNPFFFSRSPLVTMH